MLRRLPLHAGRNDDRGDAGNNELRNARKVIIGQHHAAAFAAVNLARVTDDRARDLPPALREQIIARLAAVNAPAQWSDMLRGKVELDVASERRVLGESLPPGLKLVS